VGSQCIFKIGYVIVSCKFGYVDVDYKPSPFSSLFFYWARFRSVLASSLYSAIIQLCWFWFVTTEECWKTETRHGLSDFWWATVSLSLCVFIQCLS